MTHAARDDDESEATVTTVDAAKAAPFTVTLPDMHGNTLLNA